MKIKINPAFALFLLLITAGALNYYFLVKDTITPLYDANVCYSISYNYYDNLIEKLRFDRFFHTLMHNINFYPPLYMLIPLPFYIISGISPDAMAMVNLLYFAILIYAVYKIGNFIYGRSTGFFAVILLILFPSILGFTRLTHITIALTAILTLNVYLFLRSDSLSNLKFSVRAGILAGIGMLFSSEYWVYIVGPLLLCLINMLRKEELPRVALKIKLANFVLFLASMVGVLALYYLPSTLLISKNLNFKLQCPGFAISNFSITDFFYRIKGYVFILKTQTLTCNFMLFLIALIILKLDLVKKALAVVFLGWFLMGLLIIASWPTVEPRFIFPILPSIALVTAGLSPRLLKAMEKFSLKARVCLSMIVFILIGTLNFIFFMQEHPCPKNSLQLSQARWEYGMLHVFTGNNPSTELFSYFNRHNDGKTPFRVVAIFDNSADPAPLAIELIHGELFNSKLDIEFQSAMRLAVSAWYAGMDNSQKQELITEVFKQANYILFVRNSIHQETGNRLEYDYGDNERLKEMLKQEEENFQLVWEYQDKNNFFTETMQLFKKIPSRVIASRGNFQPAGQ